MSRQLPRRFKSLSEHFKKNQKGDLDRALEGDYSFDVKAVLKEGWALTKLDNSALLFGMLFVFLVAFIVVSLAQFFAAQRAIELHDPYFLLGSQVVLTVVTAPFTAALVMMGINNSIGGKSKFSHLFNFVNRTFILLIAILMTSILVDLGLRLLLIPGIYLFIATGFVIPLILDKGLLPSRALVVSIKVVTFQWLNFIKLYAFFALLFLLVVVTFGIALIWVAPFYYNVKGLLYRDIFGVGVEHQVTYPSEQNEAHSDNSQVPTGKSKEEFFDA